MAILQKLLRASNPVLFLFLPFVAENKEVFRVIKSILEKIGFSIPRNPDKSLTAAAFISFICIAFVIFSGASFTTVYNRLTMFGRRTEFSNQISKIKNYHNALNINGSIQNILASNSASKDYDAISVIKILIDLLVTDLRDCFQQLLRRDDVRVSLFIDKEKRHEDKQGSFDIGIWATSVFDYEFDKDISFKVDLHSGISEGFCGNAWASGKSVCGSSKKFRTIPFLRDNRYSERDVEDGDRSFFCIPVFIRSLKDERVYAVISIDSSWKYDFMMGDYLIKSLTNRVRPVSEIIANYLYIQMMIVDLKV